MKRALILGGLFGLILLSGCFGKSASGPSSAGWSGFDPEKGKFTVAMPGTPTEKPNKEGSGDSWSSTADGMTYSVSYQQLNLPAGAADTDQAERVMDNEVTYVDTIEGGTITGQKKPLVVGGEPGRELDVDVDGKTMRRIRMCVAGDRLYKVEVSGPKDKVASSDADSFLDSFRVSK